MRYHLLFTCFFLMALSCSQTPVGAQNNDLTTANDSLTPDQKAQLAVLKSYDQKLQTQPDSVTAAEALEIAEAFLDFYKAHIGLHEGIQYLYKAGEINISQPGRALFGIGYFAEIFEVYPEHPLAPNALFMTGLAFDEMVGDKTRAAQVYQIFIDTYPNHELVAEARNLIQLHEAPADELEMVKAWMEKAKK